MNQHASCDGRLSGNVQTVQESALKSTHARLSDAPECGVKAGKLLCFEGLNPDQAWNSTSVAWAACHLWNSSLKPSQVGSSKKKKKQEVFGEKEKWRGLAHCKHACAYQDGVGTHVS